MDILNTNNIIDSRDKISLQNLKQFVQRNDEIKLTNQQYDQLFFFTEKLLFYFNDTLHPTDDFLNIDSQFNQIFKKHKILYQDYKHWAIISVLYAKQNGILPTNKLISTKLLLKNFPDLISIYISRIIETLLLDIAETIKDDNNADSRLINFINSIILI